MKKDRQVGGAPKKSVRLRIPFIFPPIRVYVHDVYSEFVSDTLEQHLVWDIDQTILIMRSLGRGSTAIDVGANIGYHALLFSRCVGRKGRVYVVEPEPSNLAVLRANIARSSPRTIEVVPVALSDESGTGPLYLSPDNLGDHRLAWSEGRTSRTVQLARADDVFGDVDGAVHFVKIDVQGAEHRVLCGMHRLIERNAGELALLLEFSPRLLIQSGTKPDEFIDHLRALGARTLRFAADGRGGLRLWCADDAELKRFADECLASDIEDLGKDLFVFFSLAAEVRFRQRLLAPWPGLPGRLWRWSGYA